MPTGVGGSETVFAFTQFVFEGELVDAFADFFRFKGANGFLLDAVREPL